MPAPRPAVQRATSSAAVPLQPCKVVVVDDTPVNVKVLMKLLSKATSVPLLSHADGQAAVELVEASSPTDDPLLFFMDWHMPGVCGLAATESIRRIVAKRGGPRVHICLLTADIEGLPGEMEKRNMSCNKVLHKAQLEDSKEEKQGCVLDIVAGKPVTFKSLQVILKAFNEQLKQQPDKIEVSEPAPSDCNSLSEHRQAVVAAVH